MRDPTHNFTFAANNNGRNSSASLNASTVGSYVYNALEQRSAKTAGGATIQFVYDSAGHLIEEADASTGAPIREYVWIDDLPLALIDDTGSSPVIYYIHTDQVGALQKITDGSGALVWDGVFDPFGNQTPMTTPTTTPTNWGTGIWGSFNWAGIPLSTNQLRFPGQYYDMETQTAQNWARDYDASTGRYIQADPLGIGAGVNVYAYANGNPQGAFDLQGLDAYFITEPIGFPFVGYHTFTVVSDSLGGPIKDRFSYGPDDALGALGIMKEHLTEQRGTNSLTDVHDVEAWRLLRNPREAAKRGIYAFRISAADAIVICRGRYYDTILGTPKRPGSKWYNLVPKLPGHVNSNSATSAIVHSSSSRPVPTEDQFLARGMWLPGWDAFGALPK